MIKWFTISSWWLKYSVVKELFSVEFYALIVYRVLSWNDSY